MLSLAGAGKFTADDSSGVLFAILSESEFMAGTPSKKTERRFLLIFGEHAYKSRVARQKEIIWEIMIRFIYRWSYLAGLTNPYTLILSGPN